MRPVAVCVAVTVVPGRTLPLESRTVPAIDAVPCARTGAPTSRQTKRLPATRLTVRIISLLLFRPRDLAERLCLLAPTSRAHASWPMRDGRGFRPAWEGRRNNGSDIRRRQEFIDWRVARVFQGDEGLMNQIA